MRFIHHRLCAIGGTVLALALGTVAAELTALPATGCLLAAWLMLAAFVVCGRRPTSAPYRRRRLYLFVIITLLAAARWTAEHDAADRSLLRQLTRDDDVTIVLEADVTSVPVQFERPALDAEPQTRSRRWQTRFIARGRIVRTDRGALPVSGSLRVFVDGQAARRFGRGDRVRLTGRLSWPDPPGNPGEFDFDAFLRRRLCSGLLYLNHPNAIEVQQRSGPLSPGYWLTRLRRSAETSLNRSVAPEYQSIASALLLGSRCELRTETEDVFIGSGTMHLLAISGLHIGILCVLLLRLGHGLLIPWNQRLLAIAAFCVVYALLTDLRPSVVRATAFALLFTASQISLRQVSLFAVIGQTACLMLLWQPHLIFDTGAWLSFLSVMGLAWAARSRPANHLQDRLASPANHPPLPITTVEHLQSAAVDIRRWLAKHYRPMLWILAATVPLTAWVFHVVAPVGLIVNVGLIAYTTLTLGLGFAALMLGALAPYLPNLPGIGFSWMLAGLTTVVEFSADIGIGHLYLPAPPWWFLPSWYCFLVAAALLSSLRLRRLMWLCLCGIAAIVLWNAAQEPVSNRLRCTILDVGHGSAALVELPGRGVLLVDAGAMNRGEQAGELISRCLWSRGHRTIHSIVVSHADADHFNALRTILARFPAGELLVSQQFLHNTSAAAQSLITQATAERIPVRIVGDGTTCRVGDTLIRLYQATPPLLASAHSDNEKSLVVELRQHGRTILLPGDLEGPALEQVLPRLPTADVLVSPHHGSRMANIPQVRQALQPQHVVVSARDDDARVRLQKVYDAAELHFTSEAGAVTVAINNAGQLSVHRYRSGQRRNSHDAD